MKNSNFDGKICALIMALCLACINGGCTENHPITESRPAAVNTNMPTQDNQNKKNNENVSDSQNPPSQANTNAGVAVGSENLVTNTGLGSVRIGMQMKEIKRKYPDSTFKIVASPLDNVTSLVEVTQNGEKLFYFSTENFSDVEEIELPKDADKIFFLVTDNPRFATAEGIKVGQTFGDAEKIYGKAEFFNEQISNFISFKNSGVKNVVLYSVRAAQNEVDKKYAPNAKITHIGIGKDVS